MATYIQGIQDYIPQIQPFQPDFNFFQTALEQKQAQYQAGYNKISQIYGQLLNSNLMRQANIDRRDELFTEIDSEIQRLSGVDLSLEENVKTASQLFQPLIDNPYFRKDLVYTKQYGNAKSKQSSLRNNPNPKSDERAWEIGDMALEYQASDFSKSTDEESMRFASPEYVPSIDITEKLFKFAKDNDINPENIVRGGGYIYKYTNGVNAVATIQNVFNSILASDPRVKRMYSTQAYVDRKNYMTSNAEKFQGDERAAEMEYLQDKTKIINDYYKSIQGDTQKKLDDVNTKKRAIESNVNKNGVDPDIDPDLIALYEGAKNDSNILSGEVEIQNEVLTNTDAIDFANTDLESLRYRVDNAMSYFLMDQAANENAISYATSKQKIDFQVDQIYLENLSHSHAMALEDKRFANDKHLKLMDIVGEILKENGALAPGGSANPAMDFGITITDPKNPSGTPGNTALGLDVANLNARAGSNFATTGAGYAYNNLKTFVDIQNAIIASPDATPEQRADAENKILTYLGTYSSEEVPSSTRSVDAPTDWLGGTIHGLGGIALGLASGVAYTLGVAGTPFTGGFSTVTGAALGTAAAGGAFYELKQASDAFFGEQTVTDAGYIKSSSGYVTKNPDGTYKLVAADKIAGFNDPASPNYFAKANKNIATPLEETAIMYRNIPEIEKAYQNALGNNREIDRMTQAYDAVAAVNKENLEVMSIELSNTSGQDTAYTKMFFDPIRGGAKAYIPFREEYAQKELEKDPNYGTLKSAADAGDQNAKRQLDEMKLEYADDAEDVYEDMVDSYEDLLKTPTTYLTTGVKSINKQLMDQSGAEIGTASMYPFDAYNFDTQSFKMGMDMYVNDILPAVSSTALMSTKGSKVMFGSGFDITRDQFNEFDVTSADGTKATNILKAFFAGAQTRYGNQVKTEDGRSIGNIYYHKIAAGDANKMAATLEPSPEWIAAHKGVVGDWATEIAEGKKDGSITFFIDADKAESTPFRSMQITPEEAIINTQGQLVLNSFAKEAGTITLTSNSLGGFSYNGYLKSYNQLGQMLHNPVFGDYNEGDLTSMVDFFTQMTQNVAAANTQFKQSLRENSDNKINSLNTE